MNLETAANYLKKGNKLKREEKYLEALAAYRRAIELNPSFSWYYHYIGEIWKQLKGSNEAIAAYHKAIELNPNLAWSYHNLGKLLVAKEALSYLQKAVEINPNNYIFNYSLGLVWWKKGELESALLYWQKAVILNPNYARSYYYLGEISRKQKKLEEAISHYLKAIDLHPHFVKPYGKLGSVFLLQEKLDKAAEAFSQAIEILPDNFNYYQELGKIRKKLEHLDDAATAFEKAIEIKPNLWSNYYELADIYKIQGKLGEAEVYFRQAMELNPDSFAVCQNLGDILEQKGELEEAIAFYSKAIELDQRLAKKLQLFSKMKGYLAEDIDSYRREIEINYNNFEAYNSLGKLLKKTGKLDEAISCYSRAIELNYNLEKAYVNKGKLLEFQGRFDEAIACYAKFHPDLAAEVCLQQGKPWEKQGKVEQAIDYYQKFLDFKNFEANTYISQHFNNRKLPCQSNLPEQAKKIKRLIVVKPTTGMLNVISILRYQEAIGEYQDCEDYLLFHSNFFMLQQVLEVAKNWNFHQILSLDGISQLTNTSDTNFIIVIELLRKILSVDFDAVYVPINKSTAIFRLVLQAYSNARKIVYGDSLGQLSLAYVPEIDDAYLIIPEARSHNTFEMCKKVVTVEPKFYKSVIYDSAQNFDGLASYCQEIQELLGGAITICLTKYYSDIGWTTSRDIETEIQMYLELTLTYTKPGEAVLVKGHPGRFSKNRAEILAEKLCQFDRKAIAVSDLFQTVAIDLFVPFLNISKAITFTSSASISLAYLAKCEVILGFGEKIINDFIVPEWRSYLRGSERVLYSQVQQAYREKFKPIYRIAEQMKVDTKFPTFPVNMRYQDFV